ncbi:MAG: nucleotidyltransferase domain-containing protein [Sulfuricella sp.]|nr:nucleotidyltransferase domain-containing protein [Sulfuricella sp.]
MNLLFGTYRQRILSVLLLNPESSYHVRELARMTGTTAGTLHKELSRLAATGLLLREKQGNQVRYQANRQCPIYSELAGLFRKTTGLADVLAAALQPLADNIEAALVFGSVARGEETAGSDVDLLIVGDVDFGEAVKALYPAQAVLSREINPVVVTRTEIQERIKSGDHFIQQILRQSTIPILGKI